MASKRSLERRHLATASVLARDPDPNLSCVPRSRDNAATADLIFTSDLGSTTVVIRLRVDAARFPRKSSSLTTVDGRLRFARAASVAAFHLAQILRRSDRE